MSITPVLADSAIDIKYIVDGLSHKIRMRCNRTSVISGDWYLAQASGSGIKAADAADMVFTRLAPLYNSVSSSFVGYDLFSYVSGAYYPLETGSTAITPTGSSPYQKAQSFIYTLRDDAFKKVRFIMLEGGNVPLNKFTYSALSGDLKALADSIIAEGDANIGSWYCGRGDAPVNTLSFLSAVGSLNRRIRRRRGMV